MNSVIIIPARMASTRLPNKPLADIAGLPMVVQVMKRAEESKAGDVYVACCEQEVYDAVTAQGGNAVMTDPDLPSGSDRINAALRIIDPEKRYDFVVNVQGDEPTLNPEFINKALSACKQQHVEIATLAAPIKDKAEETNPNVVKAIVAWNKDRTHGKALYFTRACAPSGTATLYQHIGLYAYKRSAIEGFTSLPPSPLELSEKLEQLRALENHMHVEVVATAETSFGVDTPEDLEKARQLLENADD